MLCTALVNLLRISVLFATKSVLAVGRSARSRMDAPGSVYSAQYINNRLEEIGLPPVISLDATFPVEVKDVVYQILEKLRSSNDMIGKLTSTLQECTLKNERQSKEIRTLETRVSDIDKRLFKEEQHVQMKEEELKQEKERFARETHALKTQLAQIAGSETGYQVKIKKLESEYVRLEERVQKELRAKDGAVRAGLKIVGTLRSRVDAPPSASTAAGSDGEAALLRHSLAAMTSRCDALCHEVSEGQAVVRSLQGKLLAAHELTSRMRSLVHARWGEGGASEEGEGEEEEAHTSGPYLTAGARKGVDTVTSAMLQHMEDQAREIEALMAAGLEDAPTAIELQAATDTIRKQKALIQSLQATVTSLIASASQPDSECVWELTQKEKALREREEHVYSLQQAVEAKADLLATQEREMKATFDELMDTAFQTAFGSITVSEPNPPKVSLSMRKGPSGEDRASATGMSFVVSPPGKGRAVKKPVLKGAGLKKPRVVDVAADAEAPPFKKPAATNVGPREPLGQLTNTPKGYSYSPLRLQVTPSTRALVEGFHDGSIPINWL